MVQITLYHYTSKAGGLGIKTDKMIKKSDQHTPSKRRLHGEGVYFTSLDPNHNPEKLVLNNFTKGAKKLRPRGSSTLFKKIHYVVRVTFEEDEVEKIQDGGRDIYLYRGDVDLTKYPGYEVKHNRTP